MPQKRLSAEHTIAKLCRIEVQLAIMCVHRSLPEIANNSIDHDGAPFG